MRDLNFVYRDNAALFSQDNSPMGFQWLKGDDAAHNLLAYVRWGADGQPIMAVVNLSGASHMDYRLGMPEAGTWELLINTDQAIYGGAGNDLPDAIHTEAVGWDNFEQSVQLHVPALSVQWYKLVR